MEAATESTVTEAHHGRVTPAEYLERFNQQFAEDLPEWELPYWLREIHKRADIAERVFALERTFGAGGTRVYHPHTLALAFHDMYDGSLYLQHVPRPSNGWLANSSAAPLIRLTTEERAASGFRFAWGTAQEYIVEPFEEPEDPSRIVY